MKMVVVLLALVASAAVFPVSAIEVNPIEKVLEMLAGLEAKIIGEGETVQKVYDDFAEWCEDRSKDLSFQIKTEKAEIVDLKAVIEEESASIDAGTTRVEELGASSATNEADLKAAIAIRGKESADFAAVEEESMEIISTLERAIRVVEKGSALLQTKTVSSIAQALDVMVKATSLNTADAERLKAFVQTSNSEDEEDDDSDSGAPDAAAYEEHSSNIVETLESLLDKANGQLDDARKQETSALNNFEMLKQSLEAAIKNFAKDMDNAKSSIAESEEKKSSASGNLVSTTKSLAADTQSLEDLHHDCMAKAQEFQEETKSRGEELKALAQAKKVIKETTGGAALNQVSFMQMRSKLSTRSDLGRFEVVRFVRDLAQKHKSAMLMQLAVRISGAARGGSGDDVFAKVKGLITDMIEKLLGDSEADATHKAFCDKEMAETSQKNDDKSDEIEKLTTKIDSAAAESARLGEEVVVMQKGLANLISSQAAMDKVRREEHEAFVTDKADMDLGLSGVKKALEVLRDYYAQDDKDHDSADGAGAGIISLLEVVESDFEKGLAEIVAAEESAKADYDQQTKDNEIDKAAKDQDVKYKSKMATDLSKTSTELASDRSGVQEELDAVLEYFSKIKEQCVAKAEPYEERKGRREQEIAGLKQALEVLEGETAFLQQSTRHALRGVRKHSA